MSEEIMVVKGVKIVTPRDNEGDEGLDYVSNMICQRGLQIYCGSKIPPLDFSQASLLLFDATSLKIKHHLAYKSLLRFQFMCKRWINLERFHGRGNTPRMKSYIGKELKSMDASRDSVNSAIDQYNYFTKKGKLKLERLIQANYFGLYGQFLYATFYAIDMESSSSGVYQAAIAEYDGQKILGLLRDFSKDKILAILSVSGVDKAVKQKTREVDGDLVVKKKNREVDGDLALEKKIHRVTKAVARLLRK